MFAGSLWGSPDCGSKTRKCPETQIALVNMLEVAKQLRQLVVETTVS
ncbi:hypothetical protein [Mucilaginibacter sp. SP1R1]